MTKGTCEPVYLGQIYIGKLMTWPDTVNVRFFYLTKHDPAKSDGIRTEDDFPTRRAFDIWLAAQLAGKTLSEI